MLFGVFFVYFLFFYFFAWLVGLLFVSSFYFIFFFYFGLNIFLLFLGEGIIKHLCGLCVFLCVFFFICLCFDYCF